MTTTKTARPAQPTKRVRSGTKTRASSRTPAKASPGRRYTDEQRAEALRLVEGQGTAHAHKVTGVPKPTLTRWAKAAGLDTGEAARRRTAAATEAVRARAAEVKLSTVDLLEAHIAQAGEYLRTVAGVNARAAQLIAGGNPDTITMAVGMAGPYAVLAPDSEAAELGKVALALAGLPLAPRDAEGILTRAVHDLQLLRGEATERGELVVEFNVPRPHPGDTPVVEQPRALEEGPA